MTPSGPRSGAIVSHMATLDEALGWALLHADVLEQDMHWRQDGSYGGWWEATNEEAKSKIRARAVAALAFLHSYAGHDSQWTIRASMVFDDNGDRQSMESGARAIADVIRGWVEQVRAGVALPRIVEAQGARAIASTDLMEQVRALVEDPSVSPAAPIVLAGAALEIALRSAVDELGLMLSERPTLTAYARCLRSNGALAAQDMKDVEQIAGLRNAAAHGHHDELSRERAGLMEQQVNLFLGRLAGIVAPAVAGPTPAASDPGS